MRNYREAIDWYKENQTARQIGFNPDGMCLKVCRTARSIGAKHLSAKEAQDATPLKHRVHNVRDLRRGMILYFDDPNDSNRFGHIVTMIGRVQGFNPDSLSDVLVETNSVKSGELVVVRGDYFPRHWNDKFQFGATWLNGLVLDIPQGTTKVQQFKASGPNWNVRLLDEAVKRGRRELVRTVNGLDQAVEDLPNDKIRTRVTAFTDYYEKNRILKMPLLNDAVNKGDRTGAVKTQRDKIRQLIKSLPDR